MTPDDFRIWRNKMGITQTVAAEALGITLRTVGNYERAVTEIPKSIGLATEALAHRKESENE